MGVKGTAPKASSPLSRLLLWSEGEVATERNCGWEGRGGGEAERPTGRDLRALGRSREEMVVVGSGSTLGRGM